MRTAIKDKTSLEIYFKQISKFPLLKIEEEKDLAEKMKKGNNEARNKLINSNLRYVIKVAKRYQNKGLPLNDLINEGNVGLIDAIDKYDSKKSKFITYADYWIRRRILKALYNKSRIIRIPEHKSRFLLQIKSYDVETHEKEYTDYIKRISKDINIPYDLLNHILKIKDVTSIESIRNIASNQILEDKVMDDMIKEEICSVINSELNERELIIIEKRFGFNGYVPQSYKTIAKSLGLSYERIRQIEKKVLTKLKKNKLLNRINSYE